MEDTRFGDCKILIESHKVKLKDGTSFDSAELNLTCDFRFGGVDSIRRLNNKWVEVFTWRVVK